MSPASRRLVPGLALVAWFGFACGSGSDPAKPEPGPQPAQEPVAAPSPDAKGQDAEVEAEAEVDVESESKAAPKPSEDPDSAHTLDGLSLGPSGDPERIYALIADGESAAKLPVVASDPGQPFEPGLEQKLRPPSGPSSSVRQLAADVGPGLDPTIVARIIRAHMGELRTCYELALGRKPFLGGELTVQFEVDAAGKVNDAQIVESNLDDTALETCFVRSTGRWKFPKPKGGAAVVVRSPYDLFAGL